MSELVAERSLPVANTFAQVNQMINDSQANFDTLFRQTPQVADDPPASSIRLLAQGSDGMWHTFELVAGAGVTITVDETARTITFTSP